MKRMLLSAFAVTALSLSFYYFLPSESFDLPEGADTSKLKIVSERNRDNTFSEQSDTVSTHEKQGNPDEFGMHREAYIRERFAECDSEQDAIARTKSKVRLSKRLLLENLKNIPAVWKYLDSPNERHEVLSDVVPRLIRKAPKETIEAIFENLSAMDRNVALRAAVVQLASTGNLQSAADTQLRMAYSDDRNDAVAAVASNARSTDSDRIFEWMKRLLPDEAQIARRFLADNMRERRDENGLRTLLGQTDNLDERKDMIESIVAYAAQRGDISAAVDFSGSLSGVEKQIARGTFLVFFEKLKLADGLRSAMAISDAQARYDTVAAIVGQNVAKNPESAAKSVLALPAEDAQQAIGQLVQNWLRIDADRASQWVSELKAGAQRDAAIQALVYGTMHSDPVSARQSASAISDQKLRDLVINMIPRK